MHGCFRSPREDVELAAAAVDAGFEGVWIGDHFVPWLDSRPYTHHFLPWIGALVNEIPDVPVGTTVTCPMLRYRPPLLAQAVATLDNTYPDRFHLGVGTGEALNEAHFLDGQWPDWHTRAEMLIEAIEVVELLWESDGYVSYDGEHFSYDDISLYTRPRTEIPIHWAALGPPSSEYAGRHADHLLTVGGRERLEERILPNLERGLERAGRSPDDADVTVDYVVSVDDEDALVSDVRERGELIPVDALDEPNPRSILATARSRLADVSDAEVREEANVTDDPEDVIADLERLESTGVSRVLVGSRVGGPYRTIETFEDRVFPAFE